MKMIIIIFCVKILFKAYVFVRHFNLLNRENCLEVGEKDIN